MSQIIPNGCFIRVLIRKTFQKKACLVGEKPKRKLKIQTDWLKLPGMFFASQLTNVYQMIPPYLQQLD